MANEPLKVDQPLLQSSSEIDTLVYDTNTYTKTSPDTKITVMGTIFPSHEF